MIIVMFVAPKNISYLSESTVSNDNRLAFASKMFLIYNSCDYGDLNNLQPLIISGSSYLWLLFLASQILPAASRCATGRWFVVTDTPAMHAAVFHPFPRHIWLSVVIKTDWLVHRVRETTATNQRRPMDPKLQRYNVWNLGPHSLSFFTRCIDMRWVTVFLWHALAWYSKAYTIKVSLLVGARRVYFYCISVKLFNPVN